MKTIYLGLGSNLGDREEALRTAVSRLHRSDLIVRRTSSIYETAPREVCHQPDFLNLVVEAETSLLPMRLLQRTLSIELEMGRKRIAPKGPRVIDIDVLLYGASVIHAQQLQIPHPRMLERRFVLEPLAELAPDLRHPVSRKKIAEHLPAVVGQVVVKSSLPKPALHP